MWVKSLFDASGHNILLGSSELPQRHRDQMKATSNLRRSVNTTTMAAARYCPSCLSTVSRSIPQTRISPIQTPSFLLPFHQVRTAVQSANAAKYKRKGKDAPASQRRKKGRTTYYTADLKNAVQFSLIDAMRYGTHGSNSQRPSTHSQQIS